MEKPANCPPAANFYFGSPTLESQISLDSESTDMKTQFADLSYPYSPVTSYEGSPASDSNFSQRRTSSDPASYSYLLPPASPGATKDDRSLKGSFDLPPFNIEEQGDPRIFWIMYYEFVVTKTEAFYKLLPGYIPTEKYPARVEIERAQG